MTIDIPADLAPFVQRLIAERRFLVFSPEAEADLLGIAEFIARDNPTAARTWLAALRQRCQLLAEHPLSGESRPGFGVPDAEAFPSECT